MHAPPGRQRSQAASSTLRMRSIRCGARAAGRGGIAGSYAPRMSTRRRFLEVTASGVACAACAGSLSACATDPTAPGLAADVVLTLADYPDLADVGGMVELGSDVTGYDYPMFCLLYTSRCV